MSSGDFVAGGTLVSFCWDLGIAMINLLMSEVNVFW